MPVTIAHELNLNEARRSFPELGSLVEWRQVTLSADEAVALVVSEQEWPHDLGVDTTLLLLVLPDELARLLPALAAASLDVYNCTSNDLLTCRTVLSLVAAQAELQIDGWLCRLDLEDATCRFYVAIASADGFVIARHDIGKDALDGLRCAWQSACQASGPNDRPSRLWSDDQIAAAARGEDIFAADGSGNVGDLLPWQSAVRRVICHVVFKLVD